MKIIFISLIVMLFIPNAFSRTFCPGGSGLPIIIDSMSQSADVMTCMATREKYNCAQVEEELESTEKNKVIQCNAKSLEANTITNANIPDCLWNGIKLSAGDLKDMGMAIVKGFQDSHFCGQSVEKKREILKAFNLSVEDSRFKISEKFLGRYLEETGCGELEMMLSKRFHYYQDTMYRERINAVNAGKKVDRTPVKSSDGGGPGVMELFKSALSQAGVTYNCYTPKVKAEMFCTGVTYILTDAVVGAGITGAVLKLRAIVKSKIALKVISTAVATGEKVHLEDASKLLSADRKAAAATLLERELTSTQKEAIIAAHDIGRKEGRGFYTYTEDDIRKKAKILRDAGFKKEEREALMASGITGEFSTAEAKKVITAGIEKKMKYESPRLKNGALKQFEDIYASFVKETDPASKANYARLLGELSMSYDVKTAKAFYRLGFEKVKSIPEKDKLFFSKTKTLDNYLDLAARAGNQEAVKKAMSKYVEREFSIDAKRLGWKSTADAANEIFGSLESEIQHQLKNGEAGKIYIEAARRKQKALLEEFKFIDQTGRRVQAVNADLARFTVE